jgi:PAS domain S-box-containing protein
MSILLRGRITLDYLITGGVVSFIVGGILIYIIYHYREIRITNEELRREIAERKQIAEALKESEERFRSVAQHATDAIISANHYRNIISWNDAAKATFGYSEEEIIGFPIKLIIPERFHEPHEKGMERLIGGGEPKILGKTIEIFGLRKDGREFPIELSLSSFITDDGIIFTAIIRDITGRKVAEEALSESEERYRRLVEHSPDAIAVHSGGKVVYVNPAGAKIMGAASPEELIGKSMIDFVHPEYREIVKERVRQTQKKEEMATLIEEKFIRLDGQVIDVEVVAIPTTYKEKPATQVVFRDITGRKRAEGKLLSSQRRLKAIRQIGALASSTLDLDKVLESVLNGTLKASGASVGMIFLKDMETGCLSWGASIGLSKAFVEEYMEHHIKPGEGLTGRIGKSGESVYIPEDSSHDPRIGRPVVKAEGLNSFIGVPIYAGDEIVGVMNILTRPPDILSEEDVPLVTAIGAYVGSAIQNAQLFEAHKKAEEATRASEEKYRDLYDSAPDMYHTLDKDGIIKDCNETMTKMLGYTKDEIIGRPLTDFFTEESKSLFEEGFPKLNKEEPKINLEREYVRKDGTTFPVILNVFSEFDKKGKLVGTKTISRDIVERKKAARKIERNYHIQNVINKVLQVSLEPITLTEQLERVLDLMLSIPWLVLEKKGVISLVGEEPNVLEMAAQRGLHESLLSTCNKVPFGRCICGRAAASKEILFVDRVDGRHDNTYEGIIPHGHYCVPILSGRLVLGVLNLYVKEGHEWNKYEAEFLNAVADALAGIIERRQAEEKLEDTYAELEEAYEDLKDIDKMKDDIISNVSHELRTPITIVKGALEMSGGEEDEAMRNQLYEVAISALAKQDKIVGNIVEMAQFRKKKFAFNIEEVNLDHVVSLAIGGVKHDADGKEIKIESDIPDIDVVVDFEGLRLVLLNLLDNSVKFNETGGHVKVKAEVKGDKAKICVEDTGIGVPEEFRDKVFDKLFQVDATTTRKFAGTGMGLAVAKEIVEAHGGKIWVEGRKTGSRFCFTVPISGGE